MGDQEDHADDPPKKSWLRRAASEANAADWIIAAFTVVIALVGILQWRVIGGQLDEMKKGGTDTHELAVQAKNQADRTRDIADRTLAQADATNRLAAEAKRQADIARAAMNSSIELSREDRRPWVGLQAVQCNGCTIGEDRSLNIRDLAGLIANTGRTPALQMVIDNYVAVNAAKSDPIPDWSSIERKRKQDEERAFRISPNLPPNMAAEISKSLEKVKRDMAFQKSIGVLPPNGTRVLHFLPSIKVGREPFPSRNERVTYVIGQIIYYDKQGDRQYTTVFCMVNDIGVDFRFCPTGNDMQ